jgi:cytochrome c553
MRPGIGTTAAARAAAVASAVASAVTSRLASTIASGVASGRASVLASAFTAVMASVAVAPATAADVQAGRTKAQACTVCHGPVGVSAQPDAPHLAGQPALYLAAQLRAYRGGERKHAVMSVIAKPLKDEDIADLAAWFAAIRIEAQPPP